MMQTVQLSISDGQYQASVREALTHSCAWHVECVTRPDPSQRCVLVLDEAAFERLPLPLSNPERVVLITRKNPQLLADAWEAGIVSVVSDTDSLNTVLLAIMAAALRVAKSSPLAAGVMPASGISPNASSDPAPLPPTHRIYGSKRCKIQ
jgi:hypothetical protein